jgi:hypothetical protein
MLGRCKKKEEKDAYILYDQRKEMVVVSFYAVRK